jgi:flagellar biosynthesis protein FlhF
MQEYFVIQAKDIDEARRKMRETYGEYASILQRKTVMIRGGFLGLSVREGVEIMGVIPQANYKTLNAAASGSGKEYGVAQSAPLYKTQTKESGLKENVSRREPLDFKEEKRKLLAVAGRNDSSLQQVLNEVRNEVRTIKEKMDSRSNTSIREEHPTLGMIEEILTINDFPLSYRTNIIDRIKKEFSLEGLLDYDAVQDKVLEWIGESISIYRDNKFQMRPRIIVLVGPTGIGKTTTIAKLAANFGIDENAKRIRQVVLITIDAFRIGAVQQLEAYGKILEFPCFAVEDYDELKKTIARNSDGTDIILIDTIGKSPRDMVKLGEMKQLLDACGSLAEVHLALSAATKSSDLKEILRQFEPFNYRSVIITKLDETIRTGNIIGTLYEKGKSVSYITNGQKVPTDINRAEVIHFLTNLEGFRVNREKMEEKFPPESEQLKEWS